MWSINALNSIQLIEIQMDSIMNWSQFQSDRLHSLIISINAFNIILFIEI